MSPKPVVAVMPRSSLESECLAHALEVGGFRVSEVVEAETCVVIIGISRITRSREAVALLDRAASGHVPTLVIADDGAIRSHAQGLDLTVLSWRDTNACTVHAVQTLRSGERVPSHTGGGGHDMFLSLTDREREVLALMARGHQDGQIASSLGISIRTVRTYVQQSLQKLGTPHRHAAAALARRSALMNALSVGETLDAAAMR